MSGEDVARLLAHETTQNDPSAGREIGAQPPRHLAQRPRQNVGQHEVIGSSPAHAWSAPTVRHPGRDQRTKPVILCIRPRHANGLRLDIDGQHASVQQACGGQCQYPAAGPHIDDAPRPPPGRKFQCSERAARRAMLAGPEGKAGIQRQRDPSRNGSVVQVAAANREPTTDQLFRERGIGSCQPSVGRALAHVPEQRRSLRPMPPAPTQRPVPARHGQQASVLRPASGPSSCCGRN